MQIGLTKEEKTVQTSTANKLTASVRITYATYDFAQMLVKIWMT